MPGVSGADSGPTPLDQTLRRDRAERWRQCWHEAEVITDALGKRIDPAIRGTVVALRVHGFATQGSCEGHLDHGLPYPWVDIESPLALSQAASPYYQRLRQDWQAERRGDRLMEPARRRDLLALAEAQIAANDQECRRLERLRPYGGVA